MIFIRKSLYTKLGIAFLSQGDYSLPFLASLYWYKAFYVWSFQTGAINLDGIIRLPGRYINVLVFNNFGYHAAAYGYLLLSFLIVGVSFWLFLKYFLKSQNNYLNLVLTLAFVFNPAFLGNTAKIGLVAAASLLPICILLISKYFQYRKFQYLFLLILALNYSLLHPYTFVINLGMSLLFFGFFIWRERAADFMQVAGHLLLAGLVGVLINAYIILPVMSIGTIEKAALSQGLAEQEPDYMGLVNVANAGSPTNALTLSKEVFLDFNFYSAAYKNLFLVGSIGLLAVLIILMLRYKERGYNHQLLIIFLLLYIFTTFLSSGDTHASSLIELLIQTPIGWIFRSPLKWQLYAPFFFFAALAILFMGIKNRRHIVAFGSVVAVLLLIQSGYIVKDIGNRLLLPKPIATFAALNQMPLDGKRILFISGTKCTDYARKYPEVMTELNQVVISQNVQFKRVSSAQSDGIKLSDYDYLLECKATSELPAHGTFTYQQSFDHGSIRMFANSESKHAAPVVASENVFYMPDATAVNDKMETILKNTQASFMYTSDDSKRNLTNSYVTQPFNDPSGFTIHDGYISADRKITQKQLQILKASNTPVYYQTESGLVGLRMEPSSGFVRFTPLTQIDIPLDGNLRFKYFADDISQTSRLQNGTFDQGLWQDKVGDCYNYDSNPRISMRKGTDTTHQSFLELAAARHAACIKSDSLKLDGNTNDVLVRFDIKSETNTSAFTLDFGGKQHVSKTYRVSTKEGTSTAGGWRQYEKIVTVPRDSENLSVTLSNFQSSDFNTMTMTAFDNVALYPVPKLARELSLFATDNAKQYDKPTSIDSHMLNPTLYKITLQGASNKVALHMRDTYHGKWAITDARGKAVTASHFAANNYDNGWVVDVEEACTQLGPDCRDDNGVKTMTFYARFKPQTDLQKGLIISGVSFIGISGVLLGQSIRLRLVGRPTRSSDTYKHHG